MSNNNEKDDNLTVSKVYETLKSPTFLKNLYWDILSGIKEKVINVLFFLYFMSNIVSKFTDLIRFYFVIYIFMKFNIKEFIIYLYKHKT